MDDFDYSPIGTTAYIEFANGITTTNTYDPAHLYRLTDKVTTDGVDNLQDISYTFDPVGNITAIADDSDTDAGKDAAYVYDDLHRLTSATITNTANSSNYTRTYTYGITGNINTKSDVGTYTYGNIHPHAVTSDGTNTYTYDNNGSLTGDGTWTHTYDTRNRLTQSADGSSTISYTYDEGRTRMTKSDGVATTTYVNDYFEKEGTEERMYIYANNLKVAGIIDGDDVFYHEDHLSGSNISTDDLGDQLELNDYYPYGDSRIEDRTGGYENDYLFTGQERDEETDLYYYGARYYDPVLGRFTSVDPIFQQLTSPAKSAKDEKIKKLIQFISNPQNLNDYSYVNNNPLKYIDPTGELEVDTSEATEEEIAQFNEALDALQKNVADNTNMQAYFDLYGVDINEVLKNDGDGPYVKIGIENNDATKLADGSYAVWTNKITIYDSALGGDTFTIMEALIHEVAHWANDTAKVFGNLDPDLTEFRDALVELNHWATNNEGLYNAIMTEGESVHGYITSPLLLGF